MARMRIGQEEDVEGHGLTVRDEEGNEWFIAADRVKAIAWTNASGEQEEVEGHVYRARLDQGSDVEGHAGKWGLSDAPNIAYTIRFTDDHGKEQEVEGHAARFSDRRLKRDVQMSAGALERLRAIRTV